MSQQKRGFRLPWAADRAPDEGAAGAATLDPATPDPTNGVDNDELGDGPFHLAGASPQSTADLAPATSDVPEVTAEAAMIEAQTAQSTDTTGSEWPDVDRRSAPHTGDAETPTVRQAMPPAGDGRPARRDNPLVAGLVKAMREAAVASRDETLVRVHAEAETRVQTIRGRATSEAAELKQRADTDITEIREWSKAEIARIREQTEARIEARKTELASETERHAASVERLVEDVQHVVAAFEGDMDRFFERLLAEDDPARLAALAEQAPDAPDLAGEGPAAIDMLDTATATEPVAAGWAEPETSPEAVAEPDAEVTTEPDAEVTTEPDAEVTTEPVAEHDVETTSAKAESVAEPELEVAQVADGLEAEAAAAAEVAASEGLDMGDATEWPAAAVAARSSDAPAGSSPDDGATRLMVTGLTSVAGISAFKGALGSLAGVHSVSVSSGDPGVFIFAISHDPSIDLATGIAGLPGFSARITDATDSGIAVVAHEPAA